MKKFLLLLGISCINSSTFTQIKYWDGEGGDGLWSTAANWNDNTIPLATDNVVLDNSLVAVSYTVTLPSGAVATQVSTITISPQPTVVITLLLPVANTANPGLLISGSGDAFVLNNGAIFRNASGAGSGTGFETTNTFRINNGGHYIHNTARGTAAILNKLSTATGTEQGVFEIMGAGAVSTTLSLINRILGTFILSLPPGVTAKTFSATGVSPFLVRSDFIIREGVTFSCGMAAAITVNRDLITEPLSVFNLQNSNHVNSVSVQGNIIAAGTITESGSGLPVLELNGSTNQQVAITGTISNSVTFRMNNIQGATLIQPLTLPYQLDLLQGNIRTDATPILTLADNATVVGGSENSFVEGPMRKIGDDNFVFPIGKGELFSPIGIVNVSGQTTADVFTAEYIRTNPQTAIGNAVASGMDHISFVEHWRLVQNQGSSVKRVSLSITPASFCRSAADTYVSRWNGSLWTNEGSTNTGIVPVGMYETATITSTTNQSAFGNFTLITDQPFIDNPLPLHLLSFNAVKTDTRVALNWQIAESCKETVSVVIERAIAEGEFYKIGTVSCKYTSFEDLYPVAGINRYRIRITDIEGTTKYSHIETVVVGLKNVITNIQLVAITQSSLSLALESDKQQYMDIHILNSVGNRVYTAKVTVTEGTSTTYLRLPELAKGVYYIFGNTRKERTNVLKVGLW